MGAKQEENKLIARSVMQAMERNDWNAVRDLIDADGTWWIAGQEPGSPGAGTWPRERFVEFNSGVLAKVSAGPFTFTPITLTAEDDRVCVQAASNLKLKNGKVYHNEYLIQMVIRDGKILNVREYMDTKHASAVFDGEVSSA